jgi:hypothetical protein
MIVKKDASNPVPGKVDGKTDSTVSARKNKKENLQRKTRSRVPRRQWENTFHAALRGSLTLQVAYKDGNPNEAIRSLFRSFQHRFDTNDPVVTVLIDLFVSDYCRLSTAISHEKNALAYGRFPFDERSMPSLTRYIASIRRGLDSSLKMLRELETEAAEADAFDAEFESSEAEIAETDAAASESSSSPASAASHDADEAETEMQPATSTNEASSSEQPAPATAAPGGEAKPNANDNAAVDSATPTTTDTCVPEQPVAAESKPAAAAAENTSATSDADTPQAA